MIKTKSEMLLAVDDYINKVKEEHIKDDNGAITYKKLPTIKGYVKFMGYSSENSFWSIVKRRKGDYSEVEDKIKDAIEEFCLDIGMAMSIKGLRTDFLQSYMKRHLGWNKDKVELTATVEVSKSISFSDEILEITHKLIEKNEDD